MHIRCCLCACEWRKKKTDKWSDTKTPLHQFYTAPWCNPRLKCNAPALTGKTTSLWIIFPPIKAKTSKTLFPLTGCFYSLLVAKWQRQVGSGGMGVGKLLCSWAKPAACHAFCMMLLHWPEIRVWRATVKFWRNYIICDTSFFCPFFLFCVCVSSWKSG